MLIIADDITGAAEIAGIAWRKGMKVRLMVYQPNMPTTPLSSWRGAGGEALILATDTRSGTEEEAVKTIETLLNSPLQGGVGGGLIFKKTDSVLRGHVAAELQALMRVTGKQKALLIPQNPSKGRIVKDGIYYINGTPLDQTSFAYDPEFPAKTAEAKKLLKRSAGVQECRSSDNSWTSNLSSPSSHLSSISSPKGEDGRGLLFPDATTLEEIREHVAKADNDTLFAGGADMFEAVVDYLLGVQECRSEGVQTLPDQGGQECRSAGVQTLPDQGVQEFRSAGVQTLPSSTSNSSTCQLVNLSTCEALNSSTEKILILCGSTQSRSLIGEPFFAYRNAIEVTMPEDVFHGTASIPETNAWIATLKDHWQSHDAMIVRIGHEATGGKEYAVRLRKLFWEMAYHIISPVQGVQECRSVGVQTLPSSTSNSSTCQLVNLSTDTLNSSTRQLVNSSTDASNSSTEKILILCGSTQSRSLIGEPFFADRNAIEVTMPEDVFHGTASIDETNAWIATLKDHWQSHDAMIVRIGHEATGGKEYAVRLRNLFGEMAYQILSPDQGVQECRSSDDSILRSVGVKECRSVDNTLASNPSSPTPPPSEGSGEVHPSSLIPHLSSQFRSAGVQTLPDQGVQECRSEGVQTLPSSTSNLSTCQLVNLSTCEALNSSTLITIEGGATAYTVLQRLGISSFDVEYEYSPGVVCLSHGNMRIILKPGSYPWGNLFEEL